MSSSNPQKLPRGKTKTKRSKNKPDKALLDSIANVAQTKVQVNNPVAKKRSRFFFTPGVVEEPVLIFQKEKPINADVVQEIEDMQRDLPDKLVPLVDKVRQFFLNDIAPLTLAGMTGAEQAREILAEATGMTVDATTEMKFRAILTKAIDLKLISFIKTYTGLSDDEAQILAQTLQPVKPANIVLPMPTEPEGYGTYKAKKEKEKSKDRDGGRGGSQTRKVEIDLP